MMKRRLAVSAEAVVLSLPAGLALAQDDKRAQDRLQRQSQDQIYGSELMTQQERAEYQARMRSATTVEERERLRQEQRRACAPDTGAPPAFRLDSPWQEGGKT